MPDNGDPSTTQTRRLAPDPTAEASDARDVFVSYASQDAAPAQIIVAELEHAAVRCWIAPRDVPPGGLYADAIIRAINGSKVVVVVLSEHAVGSSHVGKEIERASSKQRPIIAVRTDATPLTPALEYFLSESQWIDVAEGGLDAACGRLIEAVRRLHAHPGTQPPRDFEPKAGTIAPPAAHPKWPLNWPVTALIAVAGLVVVYLLGDRFWLSKRTAASQPLAATGSSHSASSAPPPHSVAVLPFVNMSGDPKQDYFSDGLSEELLNSLASIPDLKVAARTSSFSFKGRDVSVGDIGRKLNVGAVLEGSVRKDGNEVRITAQLINVVTGFHLWSHTYDRDLKNVLSLQTEIATAVTQALQATLLANAASTIEIGGTQNPAAFDAYLRGKNLERENFSKEHVLGQIAAFSEAARLDPNFAKAYVGIASAQNAYANNWAGEGETHSWFQRSRENAEKAVQLAPELGPAHAVLAELLTSGYLEFGRALSEYERALGLSPNDFDVLLRSGDFFAAIGRTDAGLAEIQRAISLDQLNPVGYARLSIALSFARRHRESIEAANRVLQLRPDDISVLNSRGLEELLLGDLDAAMKSCNVPKREWAGRLCMSILYDRLHRHPEAEAELAAMQTELGSSASYQYAEIYTQWGNFPEALEWLEKAYELPDPGINGIRTDEFMDPLRKDSHFQEIERKVNLPQ
jgi:serine/threonine-protein kinase